MGTRICGPRRFRNGGHDSGGESKYVSLSTKRGGRQVNTVSLRGGGVEILRLLLPPRLGHPYQSERGINVQETARSPNPLQHKAETPHAKMRFCLEACLAIPIHILFWARRSRLYNKPGCRVPRSILILQQVSSHEATRHACLARAQRLAFALGTRVGLAQAAVWFTYFAYEEIMIIDNSLPGPYCVGIFRQGKALTKVSQWHSRPTDDAGWISQGTTRTLHLERCRHRYEGGGDGVHGEARYLLGTRPKTHLAPYMCCPENALYTREI